MVEDAALLQKFTEENSDAAFREFVERRFDFVYASALRQVGGDAHLAREVAQNVFVAAARKARALAGCPAILGWLYTGVRHSASASRRAQARRSRHEQKAHAMKEILSASSADEINWNELRPIIDRALAELSERDREAILQRYFAGKDFSGVGSALGLGENAARMRVERALEKLRARLARHGITSTAAALTAALSGPAVTAAPAGMAAAVAGASLAGAAAGGGGLAMFSFFEFMTTTKTAFVTVGLAAALGVGSYWGWRQTAATESGAAAQLAALQTTVETLQTDNRRLKDQLTASAAVAKPASAASPTVGMGSKNATLTPLDKLKVLAELQQRKLVKPEITVLDRKNKIDDTFSDLFALTPPEQEQLQQVIDGVKGKLGNLELSNAKVTQGADGKITVAVQPFPVEGGKVYDEMMANFAQVLGPERDAAYRQIAAQQFEKSLGQFGAADHTYVFGYDPSGRPGQPYTFEDNVAQQTPDGNRSSTSSRTRFENLEQMTMRVGPIVSVLPENYRRPK